MFRPAGIKEKKEIPVEQDLLWTLEIPVDNLVQVEIMHSGCDLDGPVDGQPRRNGATSVPQQIVQRPIGAIFHNDAIARRLSAHTSTSSKHFLFNIKQTIRRTNNSKIRDKIFWNRKKNETDLKRIMLGW